MKTIIKTLVALGIAIIPSVSFAATFNTNLYYGVQDKSDVAQLQEFLTTLGDYSGPITGNFYALTLQGVKNFQTQEGIQPISGYFGILSRGVANLLLNPIAPEAETGTTTVPVPSSPVPTNTTQSNTGNSSYQPVFTGPSQTQSTQSAPVVQSEGMADQTPPADPPLFGTFYVLYQSAPQAQPPVSDGSPAGYYLQFNSNKPIDTTQFTLPSGWSLGDICIDGAVQSSARFVSTGQPQPSYTYRIQVNGIQVSSISTFQIGVVAQDGGQATESVTVYPIPQ